MNEPKDATIADYIQQVFLPDVAETIRATVSAMTGREDISIVMILAVGDKGMIFSTVTREDAVSVMADASERIALELAAPQGPVQ